MDFTTIVSIWPVLEKASRPLIRPNNNDFNAGAIFELEPPESKNGVRLLKIGQFVTSVYMGEGKHMDQIVKPVEIAYDLVRAWADLKGWIGIPERCRPGIWVSETPVTVEQVLRSPQYAEAVEHQTRFAKAVVAQARELMRLGKARDINDLHFQMADHVGVSGEDWQKYSSAEETQRCPMCSTRFAAFAAKCPQCQFIVNPARYAELMQLMEGTTFGLPLPGVAPASPLASVPTPGPIAPIADLPNELGILTETDFGSAAIQPASAAA